MNKQDKVNKIYEVVKPTEFGIPGHSVCKHSFVMIGDVLDSIIEKYINCELPKLDIDIILMLWKEKRLPVEKQSEECIDYIYNLFPKN